MWICWLIIKGSSFFIFLVFLICSNACWSFNYVLGNNVISIKKTNGSHVITGLHSTKFRITGPQSFTRNSEVQKLWKPKVLNLYVFDVLLNNSLRINKYLRTHGLYLSHYFIYQGPRADTVGWGTALQAGRSRVRFPLVSLKFFIDIILPAAQWPWVRLSL